VLFGQFVQKIDPWVPPCQAFLQFGTRSHALIAGPVKPDPSLVQPFSNIQSVASLLPSTVFFSRGWWCFLLSPSLTHNLDVVR